MKRRPANIISPFHGVQPRILNKDFLIRPAGCIARPRGGARGPRRASAGSTGPQLGPIALPRQPGARRAGVGSTCAALSGVLCALFVLIAWQPSPLQTLISALGNSLFNNFLSTTNQGRGDDGDLRRGERRVRVRLADAERRAAVQVARRICCSNKHHARR